MQPIEHAWTFLKQEMNQAMGMDPSVTPPQPHPLDEVGSDWRTGFGPYIPEGAPELPSTDIMGDLGIDMNHPEAFSDRNLWLINHNNQLKHAFEAWKDEERRKQQMPRYGAGSGARDPARTTPTQRRRW